MLRVIRFGLPAADADVFDVFATTVVIPRVTHGGALEVLVGRRLEGRVARYAVASRYAGFEEMVRLVGPDLHHAQFLGEWRDRLQEPVAEHFEAMTLSDPPSRSGDPSLLRIYTGRIAEADAGAYYDFVRRDAWPVIRERAQIVAALFGRRLEEGEHAISFVTAWASSATSGQDEAKAVPLRSSALVRDEHVEIYEVRASSLPGRG